MESAHHTRRQDLHKQLDRWDKVGLFLSSLCAVHCMLTPLLMLTLPFVAEKFENPWVHIIMALFVVPIGLFAFWRGYRHHKKISILLTGVFGLLLVGGAALYPEACVYFVNEEVVTIIGSGFLLSAHYLNRRSCRCESHSHSHQHSHSLL